MDESLQEHLKQNETADILRRAKALIDRPEKWSGPYGTRGAHCAGTAIQRAAGVFDQPDLTGWRHPAVVFMARLVSGRDMGLAVWNNTEGRTHAEVMQAFDDAIALAEREGR